MSNRQAERLDVKGLLEWICLLFRSPMGRSQCGTSAVSLSMRLPTSCYFLLRYCKHYQTSSHWLELIFHQMVIYVVCYDLSASQELQIEQRAYWLNFLQSTLPSNPDSKSKWRVIVVGTKSDESHSKNLADAVLSWQQKWPNIPFHHQHFAVSSFKMDGVQALTKALQQVCATIFGQHTILIPKTYKALLESIQTIPLDKCIVQISQLKAAHWIGSDNQFSAAMRYLHSVGYIILLGSSLVCTCPQILPKITSEFISPEAVRNKLTENYNVQILDEEQIGVVLNIGKETIGYPYSSLIISPIFVFSYDAFDPSVRLRDKLALLQHVKVCFKLVGLQDENPMYLFPSLGTFSGLFQVSFTFFSLFCFACPLVFLLTNIMLLTCRI